MLKKIFLAIFLSVASFSYAQVWDNFYQYVEDKITNAKSEGKEYVDIKVTSDFINEATVVIKNSVVAGYYVEMNNDGRDDRLIIAWSKDMKAKQKRIRTVSSNYAKYLITEYKSCDSVLYMVGIFNPSYEGNFYSTCGGSVESVGLRVLESHSFKKFDYINMLVSIMVDLNKSGYKVKSVKTEENMTIFVIYKESKDALESKREIVRTNEYDKPVEKVPF